MESLFNKYYTVGVQAYRQIDHDIAVDLALSEGCNTKCDNANNSHIDQRISHHPLQAMLYKEM